MTLIVMVDEGALNNSLILAKFRSIFVCPLVPLIFQSSSFGDVVDFFLRPTVNGLLRFGFSGIWILGNAAGFVRLVGCLIRRRFFGSGSSSGSLNSYSSVPNSSINGKLPSCTISSELFS